MAVHHLHHLIYHHFHLSLLVQSFILILRQTISTIDLFFTYPTRLIPRIL